MTASINLVVECWLRVRVVQGSIRDKGPCHTEGVKNNGTSCSLVKQSN